MPKDFAVYYRGRHLKETSKNQLLLTLGESLTMKQYHNPTNKSDGIFPVSFSVSFSVRSPFVLRSFSVRSPFILRSSSVQAPFILRSSSVQAPFELRSGIEDRSKIDRRMNGESSEARRRCIETLMGNQGKGDPNKNFIFYHLNSNYCGKTYWNYFQTQRFCR